MAAGSANDVSWPHLACMALQVYQLVMEQIGANPSNTVFIDDSQRNIAAAHELGIFTVSPCIACHPLPCLAAYQCLYHVHSIWVVSSTLPGVESAWIGSQQPSCCLQVGRHAYKLLRMPGSYIKGYLCLVPYSWLLAYSVVFLALHCHSLIA